MVEVAGYYRYRETGDEDAANGTDCADNVTLQALRVRVTITHRRPGDDAPPETLEDGVEVGADLGELHKVDESTKDTHPHHDQQEQEDELTDTGAECQEKQLETSVVPHDLEHTEHSQRRGETQIRRDDNQCALLPELAVKELHHGDDTVGDDADEVNEIEHGLAELELGRRDEQAQEQLDGEDDGAGLVDGGEGWVEVRGVVHDELGVGDVLWKEEETVTGRGAAAAGVGSGHTEHGMSLHGGNSDGHEDEEGDAYGPHLER